MEHLPVPEIVLDSTSQHLFAMREERPRAEEIASSGDRMLNPAWSVRGKKKNWEIRKGPGRKPLVKKVQLG